MRISREEFERKGERGESMAVMRLDVTILRNGCKHAEKGKEKKKINKLKRKKEKKKS